MVALCPARAPPRLLLLNKPPAPACKHRRMQVHVRAAVCTRTRGIRGFHIYFEDQE